MPGGQIYSGHLILFFPLEILKRQEGNHADEQVKGRRRGVIVMPMAVGETKEERVIRVEEKFVVLEHGN